VTLPTGRSEPQSGEESRFLRERRDCFAKRKGKARSDKPGDYGGLEDFTPNVVVTYLKKGLTGRFLLFKLTERNSCSGKQVFYKESSRKGGRGMFYDSNSGSHQRI